MIRLRVSTLEAFRRVVEEEYGDEVELRERILRGQWTEGPSKWQMDAGTAWHALLASDNHNVVRYGRPLDTPTPVYQFHGEDVLNARQHIGPGLCEVTARQTLLMSGQPVQVEGTADVVRGLVIQDHKAKFSACDPRDYEQSLQWRFYLQIHSAACFRYNLFDFKDPDDDGYCRLKGIMSFRFWRYPGMEDDCRQWLERFLDWARATSLINHLHDHRRHAA